MLKVSGNCFLNDIGLPEEALFYVKGYCAGSCFKLTDQVTPELVQVALKCISEITQKCQKPRLYTLPTPGINKITELFLVNCGLKNFPKGIYHLPKLARVVLAYNEISEIPKDAFVNLDHQLEVDLSYNPISEYRDLEGYYQVLNKVKLVLSGITLPTIYWGVPDVYRPVPYSDNGPNTTTLNEHILLELNEKTKAVLRKALFKFENLNVFETFKNLLSEFSDLDVLNYIIFNYFPDFWNQPEKIGELSGREFENRFNVSEEAYEVFINALIDATVMDLRLDDLKGETLKEKFDYFHGVFEYRIRCLSKLKIEVKNEEHKDLNLPDISHLLRDIEDLEITGLNCPLWLHKLPNLKKLKLMKTNHFDIPVQVRHLEHLELLHMKKGCFRRIPGWLAALEKLKTLFLQDGNIRSVEGQIETMKVLFKGRAVSYSGNPIREAVVFGESS